MKLLMQFLQVQASYVPEFNVFELLPYSLVKWTQVRRIARQLFQMDSCCSSSAKKLTNRAPAVDGRAIPNDQQSRACLPQQVFQEDHTVLTGQRFLTYQRVHLPGSCHARHYGQMVPALPFQDNGRLSFRPIGLDHTRQQVEARFVD